MKEYRKAIVAAVGAVVAILALFDIVVPEEVGAAVVVLAVESVRRVANG